MKPRRSSFGFIFCVLLISLLSYGGCDVEFSGSGDEDDNGNGGGGGGDTLASVAGTITSITPNISLDGIIVQIIDDDNVTILTDMTVGGSFFIQGGFSGSSLRLEFRDPGGNLLAVANVTVFPSADLDLGDITITNGTVTFNDGIIVTLRGNVTENNCSTMTEEGTIEVTADNTEVIVQVISSTIIRDANNLNLVCSELLLGFDVEVTGELLPGNTVAADLIQLI